MGHSVVSDGAWTGGFGGRSPPLRGGVRGGGSPPAIFLTVVVVVLAVAVAVAVVVVAVVVVVVEVVVAVGE